MSPVKSMVSAAISITMAIRPLLTGLSVGPGGPPPKEGSPTGSSRRAAELLDSMARFHPHLMKATYSTVPRARAIMIPTRSRSIVRFFTDVVSTDTPPHSLSTAMTIMTAGT